MRASEERFWIGVSHAAIGQLMRGGGPGDHLVDARATICAVCGGAARRMIALAVYGQRGSVIGRREQRKRRTRDRLVDVAFSLFAEQGYDATTVEAIVERVGVSERTFFRYFDTKSAVLAVPGSRFAAAVAARMHDVPSGERTLRRFLEVMAELLGDRTIVRPVELRAWDMRVSPELLEQSAVLGVRLAGELAAMLADMDGREEPTFQELLTCRAAMSITATVFEVWLERPGESDLVVLARRAATTVV